MSEPGYNGVYAVSILAIPAAYAANTFAYSFSEHFDITIGLAIAGFVALLFVCQIARFFIGQHGHPLFYALLLGCFASVSSLMVALDNDNIQTGLMTAFLRHGQPKLTSHYATATCYWDGVVHFVMYLVMTAALAWSEDFRELGLFWVGSICNSLIVILSYTVYDWWSINLTCLLYVPYVLLVLHTAKYLLKCPPVEPSKEDIRFSQICGYHERTTAHLLPSKRTDLRDRPEDIVFLAAFFISAAVIILQSCALLSFPIIEDYLANYEPYHESIPYPKIQILVYLLCYIPYYTFACTVLMGRKTKWMSDSSQIFAGASLQAAAVHIMSSLRQLGTSNHIQTAIVCAVHILLFVIVPQCFAVRCHREPRDFLPNVRRRRYISRHTLKKNAGLEMGSDVQQEAQALTVELRSIGTEGESTEPAEPDVPVKAAVAETEITTETVHSSEMSSPVIEDTKLLELLAAIDAMKCEEDVVKETATESDEVDGDTSPPEVETQPEDIWVELMKSDDAELDQLMDDDNEDEDDDDDAPSTEVHEGIVPQTAPAVVIEPLPLPTLQTPVTRFAQRSAMRPAVRKRDPSPSAIPKLLDAKRYKQDSPETAQTKQIQRPLLRFELTKLNGASPRTAANNSSPKVQRKSSVERKLSGEQMTKRRMEKPVDVAGDDGDNGDIEKKEEQEAISLLGDDSNCQQTPIVARHRMVKSPWSWSNGRTITMSIGDSGCDADDIHPMRRRAPSLSPTRLKALAPHPRTQSMPPESRTPDEQLDMDIEDTDITIEEQNNYTVESN